MTGDDGDNDGKASDGADDGDDSGRISTCACGDARMLPAWCFFHWIRALGA